MIAGNLERKKNAPCGRSRKCEGGAPRFDAQRQAGVQVHGEIGWPSKYRCLRSAVLLERQGFRFLMRVENRHSGSESNFCFALLESFTLQMDGAHHGFVGDSELQVGAINGIGKRRGLNFSGRFLS